MHIRLDKLHKAFYDYKADKWKLMKCCPISKLDNSKYKETMANKKGIVILIDSKDNKYIATWRALSTYDGDKLSSLFRAWLNSVAEEAVGPTGEVNLKNFIKAFDSIKTAMTKIVLLSSLFRFKVEILPISQGSLSNLNAEEKSNKIKMIAEIDKKIIPKGGLIGPDTVFTTMVVDREIATMLNTFEIIEKKEGGYMVIKQKPNIATKDLVLMIDKKTGNEIIATDTVGRLVSLRGRSKFTGSVNEEIKTDSKISLKAKTKPKQKAENENRFSLRPKKY